MNGTLAEPIGAFLERERARVEAALAEVRDAAVRDLAGPLAEPVDYALSTTGKRMRPILCIAALRAAGVAAVRPAHYRLSCALEIVHTYSLVHDDLPCMDDDDLRRGRPTVHRVYGTPRATLAGAALLPLAARVVAESAAGLGLGAERAGLLLRELCRAAGAEGMVGGQLLDLLGEDREVDALDLEAIHRAKTGALLTASLRVGALAAGAQPELLDALTRYGGALGLAFQIADDILDVTGDAASLGKTAGRDAELRKASYPALFGLEGARELARSRAAEAKAALAGVDSPELRALADFVVERRS